MIDLSEIYTSWERINYLDLDVWGEEWEILVNFITWLDGLSLKYQADKFYPKYINMTMK